VATVRKRPTGSMKPSLDVDAITSARLGRIRQKDTAIEQTVRRLLHGFGLRFRIRNRDLPGAPDVANRTQHWAVFVHGCFWHAHQGCHRATVPKRNRQFWTTKFADNRARDARVVRALRRRGYRTVIVWECEASHPLKLSQRLRRLLAGLNASCYSSHVQGGSFRSS
jgi:DNA mismatch endonuclease, patch repair protein